MPIPETTNLSHLRENIKAVNITWTKKEMEEIKPDSDAAKSVYNLI